MKANTCLLSVAIITALAATALPANAANSRSDEAKAAAIARAEALVQGSASTSVHRASGDGLSSRMASRYVVSVRVAVAVMTRPPRSRRTG